MRSPTLIETSRRQAGFTLIELLMVIAVAAILAALAGTNMAEVIARQRIKSAASDLHLALMKTRSEAIKRNTAVTVQPVDTGGNWALSGWKIVDPETTTNSIQQFDPLKNITVTTSLANAVYTGTGRLSTAFTGDKGFRFSATSSSLKMYVCVSSSGRPYVKERKDTDAEPCDLT